ncbi:VOC family protein [Patescibacteria group bacterium]|nr:VOC family protein [Patescibacteria group bacterium]
MSLSIHHVAIICSDLDRAKRFYVEALGFSVIQEVYRAERSSWKVDLRIDAQTQIELFTFPNAPPRPTTPEAQGLRHLAFRVEDLEEELARLRSFEILAEPIRVDEFTGKRFTFIRDPDDLPIELYES